MGPFGVRTCEGCQDTSAAVLRQFKFSSRPCQGPERSGFSGAPRRRENQGFPKWDWVCQALGTRVLAE